MDNRAKIDKASASLLRRLREHVGRKERLCIIKAPPGSGKTFTLLRTVEHALNLGERIAIATQTNAQADDVCRRMTKDYRGIEIWRFAANGASVPADLPRNVHWITGKEDLPTDNAVVVATTAKWSLVDLEDPFDVLFVDEAWQMAWSDCMLLQQVSSRFVLIGDPGQIPPVVTIPVQRWETSARAPHRPAPELILLDDGIEKLSLELPSCRRLPADSVELVRPFYDFPFDAWALPGDRFVRAKRTNDGEPVDKAIDLLDRGSAVVATLPTPDSGPPLEQDGEIAALAARLAVRLLERKASASCDDDGKACPLRACDIGITATHRIMNSEVLSAIPEGLRNQESGIRVDTPERWQGLERKVMIAVHPLSGVVHPSAFDLETGRLCVMASRHRSGLIVVSRDHVLETLESHIPSAEQAVGRPDVTGRGHWQNLKFWETLAGQNRVVGC